MQLYSEDYLSKSNYKTLNRRGKAVKYWFCCKNYAVLLVKNILLKGTVLKIYYIWVATLVYP